jgi:hypothetical protein
LLPKLSLHLPKWELYLSSRDYGSIWTHMFTYAACQLSNLMLDRHVNAQVRIWTLSCLPLPGLLDHLDQNELGDIPAADRHGLEDQYRGPFLLLETRQTTRQQKCQLLHHSLASIMAVTCGEHNHGSHSCNHFRCFHLHHGGFKTHIVLIQSLYEHGLF